MDIDWIREYCLALPHTTEKVQWGDDLVFKIGEKMYAVAALEPGKQWLGFKCTPEDFADLIERPGIVPAPYLARAHWVSLETSDALPPAQVEQLLSQAYSLVFAKLPKKARAGLLSRKSQKRLNRVLTAATIRRGVPKVHRATPPAKQHSSCKKPKTGQRVKVPYS
ncbi:MAG: MmcQ/YjbR family DNA-binding protein [Candidatus Acidiferrales bacterium]